MAQALLPIFPEGTTPINENLCFEKKDCIVAYFHYLMPVFSHEEDDIASFRMITAQFYINGHAKQIDIIKAFGVSKCSIMRAVKKYRVEGPRGFYTPRKSRGPAVLTSTVIDKAQELLYQGLTNPEIADKLEIKQDTLRKAIRAGRLHRPKKKQ